MSTGNMTETVKLQALAQSGKSAMVQDFLDWLLEDQNLMLVKCDRLSDMPDLAQWHLFGNRDKRNPEQLMAEFFGVDLAGYERERSAALASLIAQPDSASSEDL